MTDNTESFPILYILMRSDLASMTNGKSSAQSSHASNAFVMDATNRWPDPSKPDGHLFRVWQNETTQGFGTVLVLGVNEVQMRTAVDVAEKLGYVSGVVHDPSYPLVDGDFCHFLPLDTCAYIFGSKNDPILKAIVQNFDLHP